MSERDLYLMFLPQIEALIVSCQQMDHESYEQQKKETTELTPDDAMGFMKKVIAAVDSHLGHQISA